MSLLMESSGNDVLNVERGEKVQAGESLDQLMKLNRIRYNFPQDLSLVDSRTFRINYGDLSLYLNTAGEVVFRLTASTEYCIPENCYLRFFVKVVKQDGTAPTNIYTLTNDAGGLGLFTRLLIESADGSEIERIDNLNHYARNNLAIKANLPYIVSVGGVAGLNTSYDILSDSGISYLDNTAQNAKSLCGGPGVNQNGYQVCIPLPWISGLFRSKKLIPAQVLSGLRIRLQMESVANAFQIANGADPNPFVPDTNLVFQVISPQIMLDSVALSPLIQRKLMQVSASEGLDVYYETAFYSGVNFTGSSVSFNVYKSVSRASNVLFITQSQTGQTKTLSDLYTTKPTIYGSTALCMVKSQLRLGSLYMAQQPLTSTSTITGATTSTIVPSNGVDMYYQYVQCGEGHNHMLFEDSSVIGYRQYVAVPAGTAAASDNKFVVNKQDLEKMSCLELSGLPVNNSRQLVLNIDYAGPITGGYVLKTWLHYIKLCKAFANNVVIKE